MAVSRMKVKGHEHLRAPVVISSSRAAASTARKWTRRLWTGGVAGPDVNGRRITCRHTRADVLIDATLYVEAPRRELFPGHKPHVCAPTGHATDRAPLNDAAAPTSMNSVWSSAHSRNLCLLLNFSNCGHVLHCFLVLISSETGRGRRMWLYRLDAGWDFQPLIPSRYSTLSFTLFGRPFVNRFALCYCTVVCLSCITLVYCIVAKRFDGSRCLGTEIGISGDIALDDPAPPKGHIFSLPGNVCIVSEYFWTSW